MTPADRQQFDVLQGCGVLDAPPETGAPVGGDGGGPPAPGRQARLCRGVLDQIEEGVHVWEWVTPGDPAGYRLVGANTAAHRLTGLDTRALMGCRLTEVFPGLLVGDTGARLVEAVQTGTVVNLGDVRFNLPAAAAVEFVARAFPLPDCCVGVVFESVTDRRLAEQAQVEGQARKSAILDSALDAIVTIDHEGMIFEWNPAAEKTFGHRRHEVLARELAAVVLPEATRERFREGLARFVATGQSELFGRLVELTARRADGTEFPIEMSVTRVAKAGPPLLTGFLRDITERRKMEDQLRQAQKMEVVGQLAGGVAHDFNNILTVIQGHAALLGSRPNAAPSDRASLQQIVTAAERAASLTRKLLAFSRKQALQPRHLNLNEIVRHTTDMLQRLLGDHIALHVECRRELPAIHADQAMIEQVLMNLAVNARDAMPRGGQLTITTGLSEVDPHQVPPHPDAVPGRYVTFTVRDTGTGIAPEHLPRLFEPFFTTKGVGKGTGLGLATIYGIVKQHQGWITVESEVDHGTLFEIHLPASDGRPETETEVVPAPPGRGGPETILVVEDEPSLRSLVVNVLDNAGYRVLQAESGPAALRVWEAQHGEVDLLLTDMVMPEGLSGRELGLRLQGAKPALRVIYSSGYSPELLGEEFVQRQGAHFLQKPYRPHVLVAMVRQCLDARPQPPPPDRA